MEGRRQQQLRSKRDYQADASAEDFCAKYSEAA